MQTSVERDLVVKTLKDLGFIFDHTVYPPTIHNKGIDVRLVTSSKTNSNKVLRLIFTGRSKHHTMHSWSLDLTRAFQDEDQVSSFIELIFNQYTEYHKDEDIYCFKLSYDEDLALTLKMLLKHFDMVKEILPDRTNPKAKVLSARLLTLLESGLSDMCTTEQLDWFRAHHDTILKYQTGL